MGGGFYLYLSAVKSKSVSGSSPYIIIFFIRAPDVRDPY